MSSPAESGYQLTVLLARIADLETRCARIESAPRVTLERARVTAAGGAMVAVVYVTGTTRTVPYLAGYAPAVNDQVLVVNSPAWSGVLGKVSA